MRFLLPVALLGLTVVATSCATTSDPTAAGTPPAAASSLLTRDFPADWEGTHKGILDILGPDRVLKSVPMSLTIGPPLPEGRWRWTLQYEGQPPREYELVPRDAAKGRYQIDEKNSIVLEGYRAGDDFISTFSGEGMGMLSITYTRTAEGIDVTVMTLNPDASSKTGGDSGAPLVANHALMGWQRASLKRTGPATGSSDPK